MHSKVFTPIFTALVIHFVDGSSFSSTSGSPAHLMSTSSSAHWSHITSFSIADTPDQHYRSTLQEVRLNKLSKRRQSVPPPGFYHTPQLSTCRC